MPPDNSDFSKTIPPGHSDLFLNKSLIYAQPICIPTCSTNHEINTKEKKTGMSDQLLTNIMSVYLVI